MWLDLSGQGDDVVVLPLLLINAEPDSVNIRLLYEQGHSAGELSLNAAGRRCDPIGETVLVQQSMQG